ncbi:MAG: protein nirH [Candidatus Parabeggiatoa sp. nov. 2]|nr:MAG: protein nirH [Beggiatoa sp. 4572_84]
MNPIDATDRRIIQATQAGLPLTPRPYHTIAERAVPNHYALGYRANGMTVWDVPDEQIDELGRRVGQLNFVSHCYRRPRHLPEWPYNLFAMIHGRTQSQIDEQFQQIAELLGEHNRGHKTLYSTRILKKTGLRISG